MQCTGTQTQRVPCCNRAQCAHTHFTCCTRAHVRSLLLVLCDRSPLVLPHNFNCTSISCCCRINSGFWVLKAPMFFLTFFIDGPFFVRWSKGGIIIICQHRLFLIDTEKTTTTEKNFSLQQFSPRLMNKKSACSFRLQLQLYVLLYGDIAFYF